MKKLFIKKIISLGAAFFILGKGMCASASVSSKLLENSNQIFYNESYQTITEETLQERVDDAEKAQKANNYVKLKNQVSRSYGSYKTISKYATATQQKDYWCGPAAAYNATKGYRSQQQYAHALGTEANKSTPFPGGWKAVLDTDRPGNNYTAQRGANYSNWTGQLKNSIIYTIDKGYPVIADCKITTAPSTKIHPGYDYQTDSRPTFHYVIAIGYDDTVSPMQVKIVDSHASTKIPTIYWTSIDKLASATKPLGIMW